MMLLNHKFVTPGKLKRQSYARPMLYGCQLVSNKPTLILTKTTEERHYGKKVIGLRSKSHTHPFNGPLPGLPRWAGTRKVKPTWILLKQETVSGSGISCKSAPRSRQITTPASHHSVFTGRMPFLPPNQQRQSTEGTSTEGTNDCQYTRYSR